MVRQVRRLIITAVGALLATALAAGLAGPAQAAPKPKPPAGVDITGDRLTEPLRLRAGTHPAQVVAVVDQVNWLKGIRSDSGPKPADRGPKYTVVVLAGDAPTQTYDLYPLAKGGPRVYQPAKQPGSPHKVKAGWYLGRLTMSETLRAAGVPLEPQVDTVSGGIGGGERVLSDESTKPAKGLDEVLGELQRLLLVNVGVMVLITLGLAGIALLIRRRTR
ncbi:hypothetical protein [Micromonospora okii]|uniref:hypothetical protein n=1 Tax=Micromonospora okii TaxID=1182970 RepID=UPI001E62076E|nr:hypothetical protein [Micromonospora okii]